MAILAGDVEWPPAALIRRGVLRAPHYQVPSNREMAMECGVLERPPAVLIRPGDQVLRNHEMAMGGGKV